MAHLTRRIGKRYRVIDQGGVKQGVHVASIIREVAPYSGAAGVPTCVRTEHWPDTDPVVLPRADGALVVPGTGEVLARSQ